MNHKISVPSKFLPAVALVLLATPASSAQLTQYYVPTHGPVTLRFSALDPAHAPIDERWLLEELTAALQAQSSQPLKSAGEMTAELSGLRTRLDQDQARVVFEYVHVARNKLGDEWGQTLTIPVSYWIETGDDIITVRLAPPQMADLSVRTTPAVFFLPTPKLRPIAELFDDFSAIMGSAHSLQLRHSFLLNGQEEASAPPQTCIANFERLLGRYGYAKDEARVFDPKRDDVFLYRTVQESLPLRVAAVPHGDGSKILYQAWVPFELRADGTVQGYDLPPALKSEVRQVLEDRPAREHDDGLAATHDQSKRR